MQMSHYRPTDHKYKVRYQAKTIIENRTDLQFFFRVVRDYFHFRRVVNDSKASTI